MPIIQYYIFQVENDLFRVHRYFFIRESVVFRDILSIPVTSDKREGDSDDNPIILEGIRSNDFKSLLWMWYDP
jgi:BTB/POZ domain